MTIQEANKTIADYMGKDGTYDKSLDALVPVWAKLKTEGVWINKLGNKYNYAFAMFSEKPSHVYTPFDPFRFVESEGDTIHKACCVATAKAIKELT
jgi:hypothetical protein